MRNVRDMCAANLLLGVWDEAPGAIMQMSRLTKLADGFRLASLTLTDDNAREVTIRVLLVLRLVHGRPIVAARLVARWLLKLPLDQLVSPLSLV